MPALNSTNGEGAGPSRILRKWFGVGLGVATARMAWLLPGKTALGTASADLEAFEIEDGMLAAAGLEDLGTATGRASGVRT